MWLTPREIKDNSLETSNKAFVFYLPLSSPIFSYILFTDGLCAYNRGLSCL